jgi:hypothetical protein
MATGRTVEVLSARQLEDPVAERAVKPENLHPASLTLDSWGQKTLNSGGWLKETQRGVRRKQPVGKYSRQIGRAGGDFGREVCAGGAGGEWG